MNDRERGDPAVASDEFSDRFTAATADLSAGGVATTLEAQRERDATERAEAVAGESALLASTGEQESRGSRPSMAAGAGATTGRARPMAVPAARLPGVGAGMLAGLAGLVLAGWLFGRWRRERERPVNRARRWGRSQASRAPWALPRASGIARLVRQLGRRKSSGIRRSLVGRLW